MLAINIRRDTNLDCLRGIAILFITTFHVWRFIGYPAKPFFVLFDFYSPFHKGLIGVTVFVFISGYSTFLSKGSYNNAGDYLKKRVIKLIPRYYVSIVIWNLLIFTNIFAGDCSIKDNIYHVLLIHTLSRSTFYSISDPLWYLGMQAQLYLFFTFIKPVFHQNILKVFIISFAVMLAVNIFIDREDMVAQRSILSYFAIFVLGYICAKHQKYIKSTLVNTTIVIIFLVIVFFDHYIINIGRLGVFFEGVLISIAVIGLPSQITDSKYAVVFSFLGRYSYSIFLYNFIFMILPLKINGLLGIIIYVIFTIVFSIIIEKVFNKIMLKYELTKRFAY